MPSSTRSSASSRSVLQGLEQRADRRPSFKKRYSIDENSAFHRPLVVLTGAATFVSVRRRSKKSPSLPDGLLVPQRRASTKSLSSSTSDGDKKDKRASYKLKSRQSKLRDKLHAKFRLVAKLVIFCIRQAQQHSLRHKSYDEIAPFIKGLHFYDYDVTDDVELMFDPRQFKSDKQLRISEETRRVLAKPQYERTEKDLYNAQISLRNIKSIADYPVRMQRKIVEVGMYEKYEAKRVIVRQGHPASAFYFILSGSVVVMVRDQNTVRPVAYLHKGMTFGELAIINRTTRQSTVIAKETLEMLSISIDDFHRIFMSGGVKNINDPDHNQFIQSLSFLKGWPLELLAEHPKKCIFHYFKAGDTMVKDSNYSDWIFIVKSGSIHVLKKLKRVLPYEWKRKVKSNEKTDKEKREELELRDKQRRYILPDIRVATKTPDDDVGDRFHHPADLDLLGIESVSKANVPDQSEEKSKRGKYNLPPVSHNHSLVSASDGPQVHQTRRKGVYKPYDQSVSSKNESKSSGEAWNKEAEAKEKNKEANQRKKRRGHKKTKKEKEEEEIREEMQGFKQEIRRITDDFDSAYRFKDLEDLTQADLDPQFVHLQTLTKGQVFGISETVLGKQPSFSVVSNGAECIMLDRQFYLDHAPDALITRMRNDLCPYPSDEEMQDNLQKSVDWESYRRHTFNKTVKLVGIRKSLEV